MHRRSLYLAASAIGTYAFSAKAHSSPRTLDEQHREAGAYPRRKVLEYGRGLCDKDPDNYDLLWRVARAKHQVAMEPGTPLSERSSLLKSAVHDVEKSKAFVRDDPALYRWCGIILGDYTAFQGSKEAIASAFEVRSCFAQALTLDPYDASAHHLMGRWALSIATMNPWTRWLASSLYAEPPKATLEEALACFERAEAISPGFWVANTYCLAKTAHLMGNKALAVKWATTALRLPVLNSDDKDNHKLAYELLKGLDAKAASEFTG